MTRYPMGISHSLIDKRNLKIRPLIWQVCQLMDDGGFGHGGVLERRSEAGSRCGESVPMPGRSGAS